MKIWPINVKMTKWGVCEVREMTDSECIKANRKNINWAPVSHGFVNLFQDDVFMGWCGRHFAFRRMVKHKGIKLPKYLRELEELLAKYP